MGELKNDLSPKFFQALLKGVTKMEIYRDPSVTVKFICEQIFGGSETKVELNLIKSLASLMQEASRDNWSPGKMSEYVKKSNASKEHAEALVRFWQSEQGKIRECVEGRSRWNGSLDRTAWRIDIKTATKAKDDMNKPVAIFELDTRKNPLAACEKLQFEVDNEALSQMTKTFDDIAAMIQNRGKDE